MILDQVTLGFNKVTLDGKYRFWWFLLFGVCDLLGISLAFKAVKIQNWNLDMSKFKSGTLKYAFARSIEEMVRTGRVVEHMSKDGVPRYSKTDFVIFNK